LTFRVTESNFVNSVGASTIAGEAAAVRASGNIGVPTALILDTSRIAGDPDRPKMIKIGLVNYQTPTSPHDAVARRNEYYNTSSQSAPSAQTCHLLPTPKAQAAHATLKIKRNRAPVWPFATRRICEQVINLLVEDELVREFSPPEEWRIHSSTEARGKGFQHERRILVKNDLNARHIAKIRQHAQDPTKSTGRLGFEGGFVSQVNYSFAELLRHSIRGRGWAPGGDIHHLRGRNRISRACKVS
jgi:hypothetical protein